MRKGEDPDLQDETQWRARRLKASYALRPKASRRNDGSTDSSGVFEIWESTWDSYATGSHTAPNF
jgi:hypothetical protein